MKKEVAFENSHSCSKLSKIIHRGVWMSNGIAQCQILSNHQGDTPFTIYTPPVEDLGEVCSRGCRDFMWKHIVNLFKLHTPLFKIFPSMFHRGSIWILNEVSRCMSVIHCNNWIIVPNLNISQLFIYWAVCLIFLLNY